MASVSDLLPQSSELRKKGYVQGRINLYNVDDDSKLEGDASRFFARTYPTGKIIDIIEDIRDNFQNQNPSGNYVIDGTYGSGKSHLMVTLYHLFSSPSEASSWLDEHNIEFTPPEDSVVVPYSLQDTHPEVFWEPFFDSLDEVKRIEDIDSYPDKSTIEAALPEDRPVLVLFDEIEDFYGSISSDTKKRGIGGFVQALTEAAAEPENELYTVTSLLRIGEGTGIVSRLNRDDAGGGSLTDTPDKTEIIRYRLFDVQNFDEGAADQVVEQYIDKYQDVEHIDLDSVKEYREEMKDSYPFHPNLMEVLEERFYNSAEYQNTRGMLYLLSCVVTSRDVEVDLFTASDVELIDEDTFRQLNRIDRTVVENAKEDIERVNHIEYGPEIINTLTLHSLNVGVHEGANDEELLLGTLRPDDRAQDILDARGKMRGVARHLHKLNGEWAMQEEASIEVVANNELDEVSDSKALARLASYIRNDVFEGNTYILKKEDGEYSTYSGSFPDHTPEIKILATLWGLSNDERKEVLKGKSNPNTILIVEPTGGQSVSLKTHTQLLTKIRRVITYEDLQDELDEEGQRKAAKLRDEEEAEVIDRIRGAYGNWIKFSGDTTIPKTVDADDVGTGKSYYDAIVEKAEADIMDVKSTIVNKIENEQAGVNIGQLLEDFRIQRGYPVLVGEEKFDKAIKQLIREGEAAIQESGGVWKRDPPHSIDRAAHLYDAEFAPDTTDPLSVGISADVSKCTPGTTGQFTITTTSEDYDASNLDIDWTVNNMPASESGGSFSHTFEETGEYTIQVTARHEETNQTDTAEQRVIVQERVALDVDITSRPPSPVQVGDKVEFDAVISGDDNNDLEYQWQIDGNQVTGSDGVFTREFDQKGVYEVSVTVRQGEEEATDEVQVQVQDTGPLLSTIKIEGESGSSIAGELEGDLSSRKIRKLEIEAEGNIENQDTLLAIRRLPDVDDGRIKIKLRVEEED